MGDWFDENAPQQATEQSDWFAQNAPKPVAQQAPGFGEIAGRAGQAALDVGKGLVKSVFHAPTLSEIASIALGPVGVATRGTYEQLKSVPETIHQVQESEQTPAWSKERFAAGANVASQLAMIALAEPAIKGFRSLRDTAFGKAPEVAPEVSAAETEPVANEPIVTPPNEPTGVMQPQIAPSELHTAGQNLEAQFAEVQRQAADLQERINAQRAAPIAPEVAPVKPVQASAMMDKNGNIYTGRYHSGIVDDLANEIGHGAVNELKPFTSGFVDTEGNFLNREQALQSAKTHGQVDIGKEQRLRDELNLPSVEPSNIVWAEDIHKPGTFPASSVPSVEGGATAATSPKESLDLPTGTGEGSHQAAFEGKGPITLDVHHGTRGEPFSVFDQSKIGSNEAHKTGDGFYFDTSKGSAEAYSQPHGGNVISGRVTLNNPAPRALVDQWIRQIHDVQEETISKSRAKKLDIEESIQARNAAVRAKAAEMKQDLINRGYDGYLPVGGVGSDGIYRGEVVAFHPEQFTPHEAIQGQPNIVSGVSREGQTVPEISAAAQTPPVSVEGQAPTAPLSTETTTGGIENAQQISETAPIHGVRGESVVPTENVQPTVEESGTGVPARGQGETLPAAQEQVAAPQDLGESGAVATDSAAGTGGVMAQDLRDAGLSKPPTTPDEWVRLMNAQSRRRQLAGQDYGIPEGMIEEGLNTEHPDVAALLENYTHYQKPSGLINALKHEGYAHYYEDLQRLLKRSYGNKPIPVIRVEGYEKGAHGQGVGNYISVSTNPLWGETAASRGGKRIQGAVDPRDVVAAGNEAEGELIIKKGSMMKFSDVPMEPSEQFVKGGMTAREIPKQVYETTETEPNVVSTIPTGEARPASTTPETPVSTSASIPEKITAAAIQYPDGTIATAPSHALITGGVTIPSGGKHGFVTSLGRFVDSSEGRTVAMRAKQIEKSQMRPLLAHDIPELKYETTKTQPNVVPSVPTREAGTTTPVQESPISTTGSGIQKPEVVPPTEPPIVTPETPAEPPTPPVTEAGASDEPHVSAIANKFTEERTKSGELGEIAPGQGYSTKELADAGLKMTPEQINQHVSDLMQDTGNPIEQGKAVRAEEARLSQRSNELSRAAAADPTNVQVKLDADNAFKDVTDFHNGPVAKLKQNWHAQGMGLQGELPVDLGTFNGLREAWLRDNGKVPSAEVEPKLRKMAEDVTKSVSEDNGAKQKLGQEIAKATAKKNLPTYDEVRNNIMDRIKEEPCRT